MTATYAATCPACGAPPTGVLYSDPSIPVYGCSWAGDSHRRRLLAQRAAPSAIANVAPLDDADRAELRDLLVDVPLGFDIRICIIDGCDAAAIGPLCLRHDR